MPVPTRILASRGPLFEGSADFVTLRGADGDLGILPGHSPLLTWLKPGEVMVVQGDRSEYFFLADGYVEALPDRVLILAESGERSSSLNPQQAEAARRAAEEAVAKAVGVEEAELAELHRQLAAATARAEAAELARRRGRE